MDRCYNFESINRESTMSSSWAELKPDKGPEVVTLESPRYCARQGRFRPEWKALVLNGGKLVGKLL